MQERKFQCFVCGVLLDNRQEFLAHIPENHEIGREYLECPVVYCKCPVRDMNLHFRKSHPSLKVPPGIQTRASIWFDVLSPNRKKRIPTFKSGTFESKKNQKAMHYRSNYELDVYKCLEALPEVFRYYVEPIAVEYYHNGRKHNYYPDLIVEYIDGRQEVWEIKPANQKSLPTNKSKWKACEYYCTLRGWKFQVLCEQEIKELKIRAGQDK